MSRIALALGTLGLLTVVAFAALPTASADKCNGLVDWSCEYYPGGSMPDEHCGVWVATCLVGHDVIKSVKAA